MPQALVAQQPPLPRLQLAWPLRLDVYSDRFRRLVAESGLRPIRLLDLRHTAPTLMTLRGVPLPVVAAWAGHANAAFTLRVYAHSQRAAMLKAGKSLETGEQRCTVTFV